MTTATALGPQLAENPDCDTDLLPGGVQINETSRFVFNGGGVFANWLGVHQQTGQHKMKVEYAADQNIRVTIGGGVGPITIPAAPSGGAVLIEYSIDNTDTAITFTDRDVATGELTGFRVHKVL